MFLNKNCMFGLIDRMVKLLMSSSSMVNKSMKLDAFTMGSSASLENFRPIFELSLKFTRY